MEGIKYTIGEYQGKLARRVIFSLTHGISPANTSKSTGLSLRRCKVILKQLQR